MFTEVRDLDAEKIYGAIRDGVSDAIWKIATNATSMPCADFYEHIKAGVREAVEKVGCSCEGKDAI